MNSIASSGVRLRRSVPQAPMPEDTSLDFKVIRHTLSFMIWPALLMLPPMAFGVSLPKPLFYGGALVFGLLLLKRSFASPETLLAVAIAYIPLARTFPATILPGINGTNLVLLMLAFFWLYHSRVRQQPLFRPIPGTRPMLIWGVLSTLSGITVIFYISLSYLISEVPLEYKAWIDQFVVFFAVVNLIADGRMARRLAIYMLFGSLVALAMGVQEMLAKQGLGSLEKSRVLGPQFQPNDYGAYLVYVTTIIMAFVAIKPFEVKRWAFLPWLLVIAKVLLATFSRGAYLALGAALAAMTWFRGMRYVFLGVIMLMLLLTLFPELVPSSLRDRMAQTTVQSSTSTRVDASSQTRLVLWDAALEMTAESPLFGKGFKSFQYFKGRYTEVDVHESDTHNMFLYVSSQMGLPALVAFLSCLACIFGFGLALWRKGGDDYARALGLAGTGMAAAVGVVNMFGSRMVNIEVCIYVWIYLAILGHLFAEMQAPARTVLPAQDAALEPSAVRKGVRR